MKYLYLGCPGGSVHTYVCIRTRSVSCRGILFLMINLPSHCYAQLLRCFSQPSSVFLQYFCSFLQYVDRMIPSQGSIHWNWMNLVAEEQNGLLKKHNQSPVLADFICSAIAKSSQCALALAFSSLVLDTTGATSGDLGKSGTGSA